MLLDASSLFEAVQEKDVYVLRDAYTLDLTRYELGNILWKKTNLLKEISSEEGLRLLKVLVNTLRVMKTLRVTGVEEEALRLAQDESLSFYDASYIAVARAKGLTLITEDTRMRKTCERLGHPVASRKGD
ncbi:type II toxin-antitoxin system VapC family toxin [Candidatus Bathyarchaeota archaeon]|nr:type II toxin-antitoxin system VapC family toxin [Candidatus Bathyarchaeota archaeon]